MIADDNAKQTIEKLQLEAQAAYQEFLKRLELLDKERTKIVHETLGKIDKNRIDDIRRRLGLSPTQPGTDSTKQTVTKSS